MNQQVKQQWLAALRSGKYKQGKKRLKNKDTFCCLGVLCDLYIKDGHNDYKWDDLDYLVCTDQDLAQPSTLPPNVVKWAELDSHDPMVEGNRLTSLNDGVPAHHVYPENFLKIANLIEKHL